MGSRRRLALRAGWWAVCLLGAALPLRAQSDPGESRAVLDNGLVILHKQNASALTMAACVFIRASARVETESTAGLRNLAHQCLLDATGADGLTLAQRASRQGVRVTLQISPDGLETLFQATADQLPAVLDLVRDSLTPGSLDPRRVSWRQAQVLRQVSARRELADTTAIDLAVARLFGGAPGAWPVVGGPGVAALSAQNVTDFWRTRIAPNNAVVAVSGPMDWTELRKEAGRVLGAVLPRQVRAETDRGAVGQARQAIVYRPWNGSNAVVLLAVPCGAPGDDTFPGVATLSAALGSGEGSRLFRALRVERGWAYDVSTELAPSRLCGTVAIRAVCAPERAAETLQVMREELSRLNAEPLSAAELQRAQTYLVSNYELGRQRNAEVAHYLGLFECLVPGSTGLSLASLVSGVSTTDIGRAVQQFQGRSVWVQVGGARPGLAEPMQ